MNDRAAGEIAADRAQVVSEFLQRKKEAAMNKHRADAQLYQVFVVCVYPDLFFVIAFDFLFLFFVVEVIVLLFPRDVELEADH